MRLPTRVWHLAMETPDELRPARDPGSGVSVARAGIPLGSLNRFFYSEIGRDHHWVDRLPWSAEQWQHHAERPALRTWIATDSGTPAGYAEVVTRPDENRYIAMFGILPGLQGRGLGGHLLTCVARLAWEQGASRVTLDTCELDGRHALTHYRARGFAVVRESVEHRGRAG
ncbi:MAG: GNAT family N-acetyltransferase [Solirubrobacterales bacterium]|nr:GNAT family N-acetyltransferase [Solirubrobacterales bacterium]